MQIPLAFALAVGILSAPTLAAAAGPAGRSNPYVSLFAGQLDGNPATPPNPPQTGMLLQQPFAPSTASLNARRPMVVCGMTLVPADPRLDARMLVLVPRNNVKPSIRTVTPTVCRP